MTRCWSPREVLPHRCFRAARAAVVLSLLTSSDRVLTPLALAAGPSWTAPTSRKSFLGFKPKSVSVKCPRTGFRIRRQQRKLPWAEFREGFFGGCRVEMHLRSEQTRKGLPGRDTGDRGGVVRSGLGSQHCFAVCPRARHLPSLDSGISLVQQRG